MRTRPPAMNHGPFHVGPLHHPPPPSMLPLGTAARVQQGCSADLFPGEHPTEKSLYPGLTPGRKARQSPSGKAAWCCCARREEATRRGSGGRCGTTGGGMDAAREVGHELSASSSRSALL